MFRSRVSPSRGRCPGRDLHDLTLGAAIDGLLHGRARSPSFLLRSRPRRRWRRRSCAPGFRPGRQAASVVTREASTRPTTDHREARATSSPRRWWRPRGRSRGSSARCSCRMRRPFHRRSPGPSTSRRSTWRAPWTRRRCSQRDGPAGSEDLDRRRDRHGEARASRGGTSGPTFPGMVIPGTAIPGVAFPGVGFAELVLAPGALAPSPAPPQPSPTATSKATMRGMRKRPKRLCIRWLQRVVDGASPSG